MTATPFAESSRIETDAEGWYVAYVTFQGKEHKVARCWKLQQAESAIKRYGIVPDGYYGNTQLKGAALRGAKAKARKALGSKPTKAPAETSEASPEDGKS